MATRGVSLWLPKAKVLVCVKPGEELSDKEAEALDEYFLLLRSYREARQNDQHA